MSAKVIWVLPLLLMMMFAHSAYAEECGCDDASSYLGLSNLSSQVARIGVIDAMHPEGASLSVAREARNLERFIESMVPEHCRKQLRSKLSDRERFQIEARYFQIARTEAIAVNTFTPSLLLDAYEKANANRFDSCFYNPRSQACVAANRAFSTSLQSNIDGTLSIFQRNGTPISSEQLKIIQAYDRILNSGSEAAMLQMIRQNKAGLNKDEFLVLVQMVGRRLSTDYDYARQRAGLNANGVVTGDQLLSAARYNTNIHYFSPSSLTVNSPEFAGVCRDISDLQGKMLQAAGFKNTYIVGFAKAKGEYHETVITQDPDHPHTLYQLNYSALNKNSGVDGARALYQGVTDASLNYRIAKPGGGTVADLPSEFGKFMAEAAGFDIRTLDPLGRPTSSMISPSARLTDDGTLRVNAFAGIDGVKNQYAGAALRKSWGNAFSNTSVRFPGKAAIAGVYQGAGIGSNRPVLEGENLYVQIEQRAQVDLYRPANGIKLTSETGITAIGAVGKYLKADPSQITNTGSSNSTRILPQGALYLNQQLVLKHGSPSDSTQGTYTVGAQFAPGVPDHRTYEKFKVLPNHVYFRGEISQQVTDDGGRVIAAVVIDHNPDLGNRGSLESGYVKSSCGMTANLSGRLDEDTSLILDRSIRRAGFTIACENPQARFRLSADKSLDGPENYFGGLIFAMEF